MSNKVVKPVGLHAEKDKDILDYVKRRNFSGYVKRLIREDIKTQKEKKALERKPKGASKVTIQVKGLKQT